MWSLALAWENLWGSSEEFLRRLGPRYVVNVYRVVATLTSAANFAKNKHALQREVSAMQLVAVALTLVPYEHGAYAHSAGIQACALGDDARRGDRTLRRASAVLRVHQRAGARGVDGARGQRGR